MQENKTPAWRMGEIDPPKELASLIIRRITLLEHRRARVRFGAFCVALAGSIGMIVPAFQYALAESAQTGFMQYLSLIGSDGDMLLLHSKEFLLSLLEALPLTGITVFLSTLFVMLWSLRLGSGYMRAVFLSTRLGTVTK